MKRLILLLGTIHITCHCFPYQKQIDISRASVQRQFPDSSHIITHEGHTMHYVRTGFGKNLVVFVHGSPGSWDAFASFMIDPDLAREATLLSVDRLGFGKSEPGRAEKSLAAQCLLIEKIIAFEKHRLSAPRIILVGHSFGGPIVAKIAAHPDKAADGVVFVAASVDPDLEKVAWYQHVADWAIVRWILPREIDNANQEILPLKGELDMLLPLWPRIRSRVVVLQGDDDSLVPPANAEFIRRKLPHLPVEVKYLKDMGHFIPWERPEEIKSVILDQLTRLP